MKKFYVLTLLCFFAVIGNAHATLLTNGDFEDPNRGSGWGVYNSITGWETVSGPGIEIQTSGVVVTAQSGTQYVELDSHGGQNGTNSSMIQIVNLTTGSYLLDFWYRPRTNTSGSNGIEVGVQDDSQNFLFSGLIDGISSQFNGWQQYFYNVNIATTGDYGVYFGAVGTSDTLGGFIDNVSLNRAPVPEPATFLLFAGGLAGLALYRRRTNRV